jgi:hypothetical protein
MSVKFPRGTMNGTTHVGESATRLTVPKCGRGKGTADGCKDPKGKCQRV